MHLKPMTLVVGAALLLTACSGMKGDAEKAVRAYLKDPDSAKFGAFDYDEKTKRGCLTVNSKNAMGGYTGDQQAYVTRTDSGWEIEGIGDVSPKSCRKIHIERS